MGNTTPGVSICALLSPRASRKNNVCFFDRCAYALVELLHRLGGISVCTCEKGYIYGTDVIFPIYFIAKSHPMRFLFHGVLRCPTLVN